MSNTSSAVKRRYNEKTYSRFTADIKKDDFERIESLRGDMSRSAFLLMLVDEWQKNHQEEFSTGT